MLTVESCTTLFTLVWLGPSVTAHVHCKCVLVRQLQATNWTLKLSLGLLMEVDDLTA